MFLGFLIMGTYACDEAPLLSDDTSRNLFAPSSLVWMPGDAYFLIANANVRLEDTTSSLVLMDPQTQTLLKPSKTSTLNFGTYPTIDVTRNRILVPDFDRFLLSFTFSATNNAQQPFLIKQDNIRTQTQALPHALEVDDQPTQLQIVSTTEHGDLYIMVHGSGVLSVIKADDVTLMDLHAEERYTGFRLTSVLGGTSINSFPAQGARGLYHDDQSNLLYVTSPIRNLIYVFDPEHLENEGVIDLNSVAGNTTGIVDMVIDPQGRAIIAHQGLQSLIVMDISQVSDNGVSMEVIQPLIAGIVPTAGVPESLELSADGQMLYVSFSDTNEIAEVDLSVLQIKRRMTLSQGVGPSDMALDANSGLLWVLNSLSNSMTSIDLITFEEAGEAQ